MNTIYAEYNMYHNSIDIYTSAGYICYVSRKNIGYYSNRHCCNRSFFSLSSGLRRVVLLFSLNRLLM